MCHLDVAEYVCIHTTHLVAIQDSDETILSPVCTPRVADPPVWNVTCMTGNKQHNTRTKLYGYDYALPATTCFLG